MFLYCNFNSLSRKIFPGRLSWQGFYILWSQGKHRVGGIRQDWSLFPVKVVGAEKMTRRSMCFIIISPQVSVRQKAAFRIQACKCDSVHPTFKSSKPQVLRVEVKHPLYERNSEAYKPRKGEADRKLTRPGLVELCRGEKEKVPPSILPASVLQSCLNRRLGKFLTHLSTERKGCAANLADGEVSFSQAGP